jgi:hypothetical protein
MKAAVDAVAVGSDAAGRGRTTRGSSSAASAAADLRSPGARSLSSEKAQRIVEAMRRSVARRGPAG